MLKLKQLLTNMSLITDIKILSTKAYSELDNKDRIEFDMQTLQVINRQNRIARIWVYVGCGVFFFGFIFGLFLIPVLPLIFAWAYQNNANRVKLDKFAMMNKIQNLIISKNNPILDAAIKKQKKRVMMILYGYLGVFGLIILLMIVAVIAQST